MHRQRPFSLRHQRGNILFLILLAIVLFAALAYAVTSQRDGGKSASDERAQTLAAQTLQYLTLMENSVNRMVLMGVVPDNLSFRDPNGSGVISTGTNTSCPDVKCQIFNKEGGGVTPLPLPAPAVDQTRAGTSHFNADGSTKGDGFLISIKGVGTTLPDLVFMYKSVEPNVCRQINMMMGINMATDALPIDGMGNGNAGGGPSDFLAFEGAMNPMPVLTGDVLGDYDPRLVGKRTLCVWRSGTNGYYLLHVLIAR